MEFLCSFLRCHFAGNQWRRRKMSPVFSGWFHFLQWRGVSRVLEGELVEYWVRHFFSDFESKQLRFASQVSVFFPLRSVISFLFSGFWNNQLPRDGDSFCRGVTRTFSAVCTTHHMPLFPLCPPPPPPALFPHPPTNVPKRKVSVSLSVYDVSKWSEKFFVAFLSLLLRHANHFNNARLRLQTHRDAWIQKIKKFPVWSSLWRF